MAILNTLKSIWVLLCLKRRTPSLKFLGLSEIRDTILGRNCIVYNNCQLIRCELGDFTYVGSGSILHFAMLGKFCSVGPEVRIGLGIHPTNLKSTHPGFYASDDRYYGFKPEYSFEGEEYKRVEIGNDVWIGCRAMIMDGVRIGDGAIIGAGAVVTKDVPPYAIVGGVPSKIIRYRFNPDKIEALLKSQWWNDNKYNEQ